MEVKNLLNKPIESWADYTTVDNVRKLIQATRYAMTMAEVEENNPPDPAAAKVALVYFNEILDLGVVDRLRELTTNALIELVRLRDYPDTWPDGFPGEPEFSSGISLMTIRLNELDCLAQSLLQAWEKGDEDIQNMADEEDIDIQAMLG